jgi:hypothetical protein
MSAVRRKALPAPVLADQLPPRRVIEDRLEDVRQVIFEAQNVLELVEHGTAPNNEQPATLWNIYQAMKMAGRLLSDAATQLERDVLEAAKREKLCHE